MPPGAEKDGSIILEGSEFHHCVRVSRVRVGDVVKLLDGRGITYEACVVRIGEREAVLEVRSREDAAGVLPVDIALGLIKAPRFDLAVEKCTELGVRRLIPFTSERCVRRVESDGSGAAIERIRRKIVASCKQSGRPFFPEIDAPASFEALAHRLSSYRAVYLAERDSPQGAPEDGRKGEGPVLGIVGPEGGLSPVEREALAAGGAQSVSLGGFRLRSETAAICLAYRLLSGVPGPEAK